MDLAGLGALGLVAAEWLALGWLSGVAFPTQTRAASWAGHPQVASRAGQPHVVSRAGQPQVVSWALRLLVGAALVGVSQLVLALVGLGFASIPLVLGVAAIAAGALRLASPGQSCEGAAGERSAEPTEERQRAEPARERRPGEAAKEPRRGEAAEERERWAEAKPAKPPRTPGRERIGWLLLGGVLAAATLRSLLVPEAGWDAYSHWGLRAQAYALAGTIVDAHSEHEYYPPLVPLLEAWLYLHRGSVSIDLGKTVWALLGGAFGICLAAHLRLCLRLGWLAPYLASMIVAGTTALLESFWTGQADLALTVYLSLAALAAWEWRRAADRAWLVQAAIFAAAAALAKFEGLPRVGVVVGAVVLEAWLLRQRAALLPALVLALAAVGGWLLWTAFEVGHGITPNAEHIGPLQPLAIGGVLLALLGVFGGVRTGGSVGVAVLAWVVPGRGLLHPPIRPLTLIVLGQVAATLLAFLLSATAPELEVGTSATRLFEHWLPLALFVAAVGLSEVHL